MAKKTEVAVAPKKKMTPQQYEASVKTRLDKIDDSLFGIYKGLHQQFTEAERSGLIYYWTLGQKLQHIREHFDIKTAQVMAEALEHNAVDSDGALRFYLRFKAPNDLPALLARRDAHGKPVKWCVLRRLVTDDIEEEKRMAWIDRALSEQWDQDELSAKLQLALGKRKATSDKTGRPVSRPKTVPTFINKALSMNRVWIKYGEVITDNDYVNDLLATTPADKYTPDVLEHVNEVTDQLTKMIAAATSQLAAFQVVKARVETKLGLAAPAATTTSVLDEEEDEVEEEKPVAKAKAKPVVVEEEEDDDEPAPEYEEEDEDDDADEDEETEEEEDDTEDEDELELPEDEDDEEEEVEEEIVEAPPVAKPKPKKKIQAAAPAPAAKPKKKALVK